MADDAEGGRREKVVSGKYIIMVFIWGVILVLAGFLLEEYGPKLWAWIDSFRYVPHPAPDALNSSAGSTSHALTLFDLAVLLLKEIGVAFMVAALIGWAIEKRARERESQLTAALQKQLIDDAVFAIFGFRHRRDFINAVVETNLHACVVREELSMDYSLRELTSAEAELLDKADPGAATERFVILDMQYSYKLLNVGQKPEPMSVPYSLPIRHGAGAKQIAKVYYAKIDGETYDEKRILDGVDRSLEKDERSHSWPVEVQPDKPLEVIIRAVCVKERSDNECWGCMLPTMGNAKISLAVVEGLNFGVREISNADLVEDERGPPGQLKGNWIIRGPMLRHNSIVFWWRTPEDEGSNDNDTGDHSKESARGLDSATETLSFLKRAGAWFSRLIGR